LARNIATKKPKAASKAEIDVFGRDLIETFSSKALKEAISYTKSKDCILKYDGNPESIHDFTNEKFVCQLKEKVPLMGYFLNTVCKGRTSQIALAGSTCIGSVMKSIVYRKRINIILQKGGCNGPAVERLNKLGICDSPKTCTRLLTAVSKCSDKNVVQWKTLIETKQKALLLLQEVKSKQLQVD
jgi:hypothetical protein